ncbi:MAG TPA: 30S ribosomal protein S27e [Thermoplasmata archaeon]|nr:30S ribosomal protein S27e [Thermoplasmata archaeon]
MTGTFITVRCPDCDNAQIMFSRASTEVKCLVCGSVLASPTGGKARLHAEVVEEVQ